MLGHDLLHTFWNEDVIAYGAEDLDITNRDSVFEKIMTVQPDVVINAAAYTNVDMAEIEQRKADKINAYGVGILAEACREVDAMLVHFSTDYVFNGKNKNGYNEESATDPINAYGRSKALGEKMLIDEMEMLNDVLHKEGRYFLIRTSWLYGHHGKNFVDTMLEQGKKRHKIEVVNDQFGKPTNSGDLVRQVKWLIESNEYPSGIYHVTNEGTTNWYEFARAIFRLAKIKMDVVPCSSADMKSKAKRPQYSSLINTKLPPLRSWQESLEEFMSQRGGLNAKTVTRARGSATPKKSAAQSHKKNK